LGVGFCKSIAAAGSWRSVFASERVRMTCDWGRRFYRRTKNRMNKRRVVPDADANGKLESGGLA
jgi:hypothetical protein